MLQIAVINESTAISDSEVQSYLDAFDRQWNTDLSSVWPVLAAGFLFVQKGSAPPAASWWLVFLNDSDQAGALAYHDLTDEGLPISKVFVKTIQAEKSSVSVAATHELCEMAVDPWINSSYQNDHGVFWAGEICDPVEDDKYGYLIGDVLVTDFVTPNWFAPKFAQKEIDRENHATSAFEVLPGGYAQYFDPQKGWVQITGPGNTTSKRANDPPPGSRRERRLRSSPKWFRSERVFARNGVASSHRPNETANV